MTPIPWLSLLAQVKSRPLKPGDWLFGWGTVGMIAAISVAIIFLLWVVIRWYQRRVRELAHSPWHLFRELCNAQGFTLPERQLLSWLAQERGLTQPAMLFVEPSCWGLEGGKRSTRMIEIERLQRRVFAPR